MTQRQSFGVLALHTLVAVALVAASTALCATGKLDASAVTGIFGAVLGFVGGAGVVQGQAIINGGPKPDLTKLATQSPAAAAAYIKQSTPTDAERVGRAVLEAESAAETTG